MSIRTASSDDRVTSSVLRRLRRVALSAALVMSLVAGRALGQEDSVTVRLVPPPGFKDNSVNEPAIVYRVLQNLGADRRILRATDGGGFFREMREVTPIKMAIALVEIASPEPITRTFNVRDDVRVSPVTDFEAFCEAIDYGRVLEKLPAKRYVKVRITRGLLNEEALAERAAAAGREKVVADLFNWKADGLAHDRKIGDILAESARRNRGTDFGRGAGVFAGNGAAPGDKVKMKIGKQWVAVTVQGSTLGATNLIVDDPAALLANVSDKRLARQGRRVTEFVFSAPSEMVPAPHTGDEGPRTWSDVSGTFSIEAELLEIQDDAVRLRKEDGKEITVPLAKLSEADQDYVESIR